MFIFKVIQKKKLNALKVYSSSDYQLNCYYGKWNTPQDHMRTSLFIKLYEIPRQIIINKANSTQCTKCSRYHFLFISSNTQQRIKRYANKKSKNAIKYMICYRLNFAPKDIHYLGHSVIFNLIGFRCFSRFNEFSFAKQAQDICITEVGVDRKHRDQLLLFSFTATRFYSKTQAQHSSACFCFEFEC